MIAWRGWVGWTIAIAAFAIGVATETLGAEHRVNLLAMPLLGVIAWNLAVYLTLAIGGVARLAGVAPRTPGPLKQLTARLAGAIGRLHTDPRTPRALAERLPASGAAAHGLAPADAAHASQILHMAAAALAAGLLASLYLRGLAYEYLAGWESTFLGADSVHRLLGLVLGPASRLTGIPLPDAAHLATLRFANGPGENAGPWIHLYAITLGLYVLLPRVALALLAARRARRLERAAVIAGRPGHGAASAHPVAADDASFARPASASASGVLEVCVLPYSYRLPPEGERGLAALLAAELGADARLDLREPLSPERAEALETNGASAVPSIDRAALVIALFPLAATPEPQTHGDFVTALRRRLGPGAALRTLVDETAFIARFAGQPQRIEERRRAWREVLGKAGAAPRFASLGVASDAAPTTAPEGDASR